MDLLELARELKKELEAMKRANRKLVKEADLSDEELLDMIEIYPKWDSVKSNMELRVGEYYRHNEELYQVVQAHITQPDWTPDAVPALFNKVVPEGVIPEWVQPSGTQDAYNKGDKVTFEGRTYESVIDGNTWSPKDYPQGWEEI